MTTNCFLFTELGNIIDVIVTNPKFILPWVHVKFTVKFTISNVDGYTIYMHIGCLNCPEQRGESESGEATPPNCTQTIGCILGSSKNPVSRK